MGKRSQTGSPSDAETKMEEPSKKRRQSPPSIPASINSSSQDEVDANQNSTKCTGALITSGQETMDYVLETTTNLAASVSTFWNALQIQPHEMPDSNGLLEKSKSPSWNYDWDGKESLNQSERSRFIYLIRHGQYHSNAYDDKERTLTPLGRKQAHHTGSHLRFTTDVRFKSVTSSTMTRALETTVEVLRSGMSMNVEFHMDPLLIEGYPCTPEPIELCTGKRRGCVDGPRMEKAFKKYFHRADHTQMADSHEIIVCHANIIRFFVCRAMQFPIDAWLRISLAHASITKLEIQHDGIVMLRGVNETAHFYNACDITYT